MNIDMYLENIEKRKALMIEAYKNKTLPHWHEFEPYFENILNKRPISFAELFKMKAICYKEIERLDRKHPKAIQETDYTKQDEVWFPNHGYGEDMETVTFLTQINEDITECISFKL